LKKSASSCGHQYKPVVDRGLEMDGEEQSDSSLRAIAIVVLCCGAVKMLHLMGVISVEGE
jgi:hypothetical protein